MLSCQAFLQGSRCIEADRRSATVPFAWRRAVCFLLTREVYGRDSLQLHIDDLQVRLSWLLVSRCPNPAYSEGYCHQVSPRRPWSGIWPKSFACGHPPSFLDWKYGGPAELPQYTFLVAPADYRPRLLCFVWLAQSSHTGRSARQCVRFLCRLPYNEPRVQKLLGPSMLTLCQFRGWKRSQPGKHSHIGFYIAIA